MIYGYQVDQNVDEAVEEVPRTEKEFFNAKTFLQTASGNTGDNLYDHLTEVLNKILAERPENVIDFFEEYSRKVKEQRYRPLTDHLEDIYITPGSFQLASEMVQAFKPLADKPPSTVDPEDLELADMSKNNMLEMLYYLEQAGLGLPRQEMVFLMLSMRRLTNERPIASLKFWGKIFGSFHNYLIIETELKEEEYIRRNEKYAEDVLPQETGDEAPPGAVDLEKALETISQGQEVMAGEGTKVPRKLPPEPRILYEEPKEPPTEMSGIGVNKKVYFVSTGVGSPWVELPDVTPKQIRVAKQIYKSFTGNLDAPIRTYPEFPGSEREYLRAQIARISSGTHIAPLGYYTFGGAEELGEGAEEEELGEEQPGGESKTSFSLNTRYEPPALKDLTDSSMSFWVHTAPYILPQGRVSWWNPGPETADVEELGEELGEEEEEDEEDDKDKAPRVEPERGPPLLTPLSEDASLETINPWTARATSKVLNMYSIAVVRSNLWPGGYAITTPTRHFYNVYLGFGLKYMQHNFSPMPLPPVQQEYAVGPEILEVMDPTGQEEEKWRIDHLPKPKEVPGEGAGEEAEPEQEEAEEEEEEEEEEEDD
ncbi:radial spoke head protein 6 homolog A [Anthonomus grandis grandis]|uniref:radial spoke head protein 6 homolog A n=1 Tax=Anthonomus grandis grandis TaxID=2921223 RepID=UPI0021650ED6|nr:radial spoke head protein 6 homolog A [Anthonomus grandis grandis]